MSGQHNGEHLGKCTVHYLEEPQTLATARPRKKVTLIGDVYLWDHWVNVDVWTDDGAESPTQYWIPREHIESIQVCEDQE